jgi:hypothetical protein
MASPDLSLLIDDEKSALGALLKRAIDEGLPHTSTKGEE